MNYKEKYEQALERARTFSQRWQGIEATDSELALRELKEIFPELKESEDERNERIRKALKSYFDSEMSDYGNIEWMKGIRYGEVIAWLEKQGERKQHLELKAGHWYFCHQAYCERADILTVKEGERFQCEKDGVVKGLVIKEPAKYFTECDAPAHMEIEQKPAWSEEDENLLKLSLDNLTELMNRFGEKYGKVGDCIDWLKSLRPQHHWKPSEEQMYILEWLTTNVLDDGVVGKKAKAVLSTLIEQLKSL